MTTGVKQKVEGEYVQLEKVGWQPFPDAFSEGGIRWKLLHVSPEVGAWTAIFDCPAGSSFAPHIHIGPGEYLLTKGRMDVRGGGDSGGATAEATGYGYEACNARHDRTFFPIESEFYMTFLGPLQFIDAQENPLAVVGWEQAQALWAQQTGQG
ncbi:MAG: acetylacetone-cleaving protein [Myxococcales bacterium]|nr:acetylacetone-cleaving protein [Myxococcales bacterium]